MAGHDEKNHRLPGGPTMKNLSRLAALASPALFATPAFAEMLAGAPASKIDAGDTAWMIAATALVLMMTIPGLALFYCGMVRKKNVLATMAQSFAAVCLVSILWALLGYTLAFSGDAPALGNLARQDHPRKPVHDLPDDVRDHHGGARLRRGRGPHALLGVSAVLGAVAVRRLRAARPLGVGRRLPADLGRARLRRRHRGAHQIRRRRARRRAGSRDE